MSSPKRQHYLPKMYLKNFCKEDGCVWVYNDKDKSYNAIPKENAAVITHYYTRENDNGTKDYELEKRLSYIESISDKIITKLINKMPISAEEKGQLSVFIALLQCRTPYAVNKLHKFMDPMLKWIHQQHISHGTYNKFIEEYEKEFGMSKQKQMELLSNSEINITKTGEWGLLFSSAIKMAELYSLMDWQFIYTDKSTFITSDNPLIYYEPNFDTGPYGYGVATPTVEKYIPLSSKLMLKIGDLSNNINYGCLNNKEQIRYLNASIFVRRHQFVYSNSKELLEFLQKRTKDYKRKEEFRFN